MQDLEAIAERARKAFDAETAVRERALAQARTLTQHCARAIRAVHRDEKETAQQELAAAYELVSSLQSNLSDYQKTYYAGYTQDALKEYAEAQVTYAIIFNNPMPTPEKLGIEYATFLKGLAETNGELRRRCLDILRHGYSEEAERLLAFMDDIYAILVTMDYADAITDGLRRLTDVARSINERTRGDLTINLRQEHLEQSLKQLETRLKDTNH